MRTRWALTPLFTLVCAATLLSGCATYHRRVLDAEGARKVEERMARRNHGWSRELEDRILALDPEKVTARDIQEVLSKTSAPRILNIHGGIILVYTRMISFSKFLIGMGYPEASLTNAADGSYTMSCYTSSRKIAGIAGWYYEKEALRPMIVGHSQGGMQTIKVLHELDKNPKIPIWNPLTWKEEDRSEIIDPLTGEARPVAGLQLPYATAVGAGGLTRLMPNQWGTFGRLRSIPDSVEEFTGFYKHFDILGGDFLGFGSANHYEANGRAKVRTVRLPAKYSHVHMPATKHLLKSQEMKDWINSYTPEPGPVVTPELDVRFDSNSRRILWAAEVWHSIKKHWVLELQRLIRARRAGS